MGPQELMTLGEAWKRRAEVGLGDIDAAWTNAVICFEVAHDRGVRHAVDAQLRCHLAQNDSESAFRVAEREAFRGRPNYLLSLAEWAKGHPLQNTRDELRYLGAALALGAEAELPLADAIRRDERPAHEIELMINRGFERARAGLEKACALHEVEGRAEAILEAGDRFFAAVDDATAVAQRANLFLLHSELNERAALVVAGPLLNDERAHVHLSEHAKSEAESLMTAQARRILDASQGDPTSLATVAGMGGQGLTFGVGDRWIDSDQNVPSHANARNALREWVMAVQAFSIWGAGHRFGERVMSVAILHPDARIDCEKTLVTMVDEFVSTGRFEDAADLATATYEEATRHVSTQWAIPVAGRLWNAVMPRLSGEYVPHGYGPFNELNLADRYALVCLHAALIERGPERFFDDAGVIVSMSRHMVDGADRPPALSSIYAQLDENLTCSGVDRDEFRKELRKESIAQAIEGLSKGQSNAIDAYGRMLAIPKPAPVGHMERRSMAFEQLVAAAPDLVRQRPGLALFVFNAIDAMQRQEWRQGRPFSTLRDAEGAHQVLERMELCKLAVFQQLMAVDPSASIVAELDVRQKLDHGQSVEAIDAARLAPNQLSARTLARCASEAATLGAHEAATSFREVAAAQGSFTERASFDLHEPDELFGRWVDDAAMAPSLPAPTRVKAPATPSVLPSRPASHLMRDRSDGRRPGRDLGGRSGLE